MIVDIFLNFGKRGIDIVDTAAHEDHDDRSNAAGNTPERRVMALSNTWKSGHHSAAKPFRRSRAGILRRWRDQGSDCDAGGDQRDEFNNGGGDPVPRKIAHYGWPIPR